MHFKMRNSYYHDLHHPKHRLNNQMSLEFLTYTITTTEAFDINLCRSSTQNISNPTEFNEFIFQHLDHD